MTCWAFCLANCADGFSREHYVSDGVFDSDSVVAYGLPWCRDRPVKIGLKNAISKILCGRHNKALSDFDNEASKLSRFVASNLANQPSAEREVTINGAYLEKLCRSG